MKKKISEQKTKIENLEFEIRESNRTIDSLKQTIGSQSDMIKALRRQLEVINMLSDEKTTVATKPFNAYPDQRY